MFILWVLLIIISALLIAMIIFGIYYIVAHIQVALIYKVLDELWDYCSVIYYYMDDNEKDIFSTKLKYELNLELEPIEFELENDDKNHSKLKKLIANIPRLYDKYNKRLESSCLLARDIAYGSDEEVRNVTNLIKSVLENK